MSASTGRILVAGIGNIFLGDDGFGVEVAQRLMQQPWPAGVEVGDFGIRGFDLAFAMLDDYDVTIMIDTAARGGEPGTLHLIQAEWNDSGTAEQMEIETHGMDPRQVLQLVKAYGGGPKPVFVVGCEPASFGAEAEGQMGLSEAVAAAVPEAERMVQDLVGRLLDGADLELSLGGMRNV